MYDVQHPHITMATITTTIEPELGLTVQTVVGTATAREITGAIESYYAGPVTKLILWDFTDAQLSLITAGQIKDLVNLTKRYAASRVGGKTAFVASSDLGFGLGRMFEIQQDVNEAAISHQSFRTRAEALEWLLCPESSGT
jgi:hypothetical protein